MSEKLLLHSCCGPCTTQCLMVLSGKDVWEKALPEAPDFSVTVLFDNPNIGPVEEYDRRKAGVKKLLGIFAASMDIGGIEDRSAERRAEWKKGAEPLRDEPEKGLRCSFCYKFRLEETFRVAKEKEFNAVATTLTLSPLKNTKEINRIGKELSEVYGIRYLETDFKKNDGYKKSIALSNQYGIYRQKTCGCIYSLNKPLRSLHSL
jgi:predicted adenine nucleotide alpha hydrolase (AANH) superfamily ATPase